MEPAKNPADEKDSSTATPERAARARIQSRFTGRRGFSLSHQTKARITANGAKVSFDRLPGKAHNGSRYQRPTISDQTVSVRKRASPESTYAARFQFITSKLRRKSNAPSSDTG